MAFANRAPEKWGLISVYTGDGKGKTTAALGVAMRAQGAGKRVAMVYFDKGGDTHYSERNLLKQLASTGTLDVIVSGLDRIDPNTGRFRFGVLEEDIREAERTLALVRGLFAKGAHDLIVLDEVNTTVSLGMLSELDVLSLITEKPATIELVLTGRNAPASFLERADLVTEVRAVKHYYEKGIGAREGFDY